MLRYVEVVILSLRMLTCWRVSAVPKGQRKNSVVSCTGLRGKEQESFELPEAERPLHAHVLKTYSSCLECMRGMHRHSLEFNVPHDPETA